MATCLLLSHDINKTIWRLRHRAAEIVVRSILHQSRPTVDRQKTFRENCFEWKDLSGCFQGRYILLISTPHETLLVRLGKGRKLILGEFLLRFKIVDLLLPSLSRSQSHAIAFGCLIRPSWFVTYHSWGSILAYGWWFLLFRMLGW